MSQKIFNPFIVLGYEGPEYFCDRESETSNILQSIESNRNIHITSIRRLGKTALLYHVVNKLDTKKYLPVYIDLEYTQSMAGLIEKLSERISLDLYKHDKSFLNRLTKLAGMIGAAITLDPYSGMPKLEFGLRATDDKNKSLYELLNLIQEYPRDIVIIMDEFQQIRQYPEANPEAFLRSIVQEFSSIRFICSGSSISIMKQMFTNPTQPLYQSSQNLDLGFINTQSYINFILDHFKNGKVPVNEEEIPNILSWCRHHTFYIQSFCNRLFSKRKYDRKITLNDIKLELLEENKTIFINYLNMIKTKAQLQLIKSIAKHIDPVYEPMSNEFVKFSGLSAATIQTGLKRLENTHLIYKGETGYQVYHVFFSRYLELLK